MDNYYILTGNITSTLNALKILENKGLKSSIIKINNKKNGCGWAISSCDSVKAATILSSYNIKIMGRFPK